MTQSNTKLGILLMLATTFIFAVQDGISRHLAAEYNTLMVVMIRYWFFGAFVIAIARLRHGSILSVARTKQPVLQVFRGFLLVVEICTTVLGFVYLGLIETYAVFAVYPLLIAALSGPLLGEAVGWRRWLAILVGFSGLLIILQPGVTVFSPYALIPLAAAFMFALYGLLTRYAARKDTADTSFFWTGVAGTIAMTAVGIFFWEPMTGPDWIWMVCLMITGVVGHYLLIKCYEAAEASSVQPFAYFQVVFGSVIGLLIFSETLRTSTLLGGMIIIAAGLFTFWRERLVKT